MLELEYHRFATLGGLMDIGIEHQWLLTSEKK